MTLTADPKVLYRHIEGETRKRRKGWECPRCQAIHAPWIDKCDCEPKALASVGPSEFK